MNDATFPAFEIPLGEDVGVPPDPRATSVQRARANYPVDSSDDSGQREVSPERLAEIKAQIEAGVYLDDAKLDVVADRLLDKLKRG